MMGKYLFVSDFFIDQYVGGAELTTQALLESTNNVIKTITSSNVNQSILENYSDYHWVITNFSMLGDKIKLKIARHIKYSIIEYDYKFCKYRSLELHSLRQQKECDCRSDINYIFYGYATKIWFMSEKQRDIFLLYVPTIKKDNTSVLSSCFSDKHLEKLKNLNVQKTGKFGILKSGSWIKNTNGCIEYAIKNNIKYETLHGLSYDMMLEKLATLSGLIFMPLGADTCPRIVIEAKLLNCEIIINNNVQHINEAWFENKSSILGYLKDNKRNFWEYYDR